MKYELRTPAKINLRLDITGTDPATGYHFLDMVLAPVSLYDCIEAEPAAAWTVETVGCQEQIPTEKNIIYKAAMALERASGSKLQPMKVLLHKTIPTGAGMGGGSGNGALFMQFLNHEFRLDLSPQALAEAAIRVGSDLPFFLCGSAAIVRGLGDIVIPVTVSHFFEQVLVVWPGFGANTKQAYALYDKNMLTNIRPAAINTDHVSAIRSLKEWAAFIRNDLESPVFEAYPKLAEIKRELRNEGALLSYMTGSGSAMIGLFDDARKCVSAKAKLKERYPFVQEVFLV